jgi:penicillin-binding protein 1A
MSDDVPPDITSLPDARPRRQRKPRVKKVRILAVLVPLAALALVSTVFGMMMAVASDLPDLENAKEYQSARNSVLYDDTGRHELGILTSNQNRILVGYNQIAPTMKYAIVAVEDRRFFENSGVDIRGIARAFVADVFRQRAVQGGSTITQQFVKNALQAQAHRTLFEKLREAALAYHLTRKWSKEKILTEYLNSVYFGNGAYGIESAARTYFGKDPNHLLCGTHGHPLCASELEPWEAALLAGMVASPSAYDPVAHPAAALNRRNLVLRDMYQQGKLTAALYQQSLGAPLYSGQLNPPQVSTLAPYFTTWIRQKLVDLLGARRALEGGLRITTTLDLDLQKAAQQAVNNYLAYPGGPTASLVAIDNATGEVRAMVGGRDYRKSPFNLATQGQRQPGSAFKPFVLAEALRRGIGPSSVWPSRKRIFTVPGTNGREHFVVNNFEGSYAGSSTLARALTVSDNSVFAAVGIRTGVTRIANLAEKMGIRTPVSHNYAISLGGLKQGVTPLDMAHAYETIAHRGLRVTGTLGAADDGPVGIREVDTTHPDGAKKAVVLRNQSRYLRVLPPGVANTETSMLESVVSSGTGVRAAYGGFAAGKTGTTENYGDAWFVGFTDRLTIAVWVGYPDRLRSMKTEFRGGPVEGGTFPALIWHDFVVAARQIITARVAAARAKKGLPPTSTTTVPGTTAPTTTAPATTTPAAKPKNAPKPKAAPTPTPPAPTTTTPGAAPGAPPPAPGGGPGGTGGAGPPTQ